MKQRNHESDDLGRAPIRAKWTTYWYISVCVTCAWMLLLIGASLYFDLDFNDGQIIVSESRQDSQAKLTASFAYSVRLLPLTGALLFSLLIANLIGYILTRRNA